MLTQNSSDQQCPSVPIESKLMRPEVLAAIEEAFRKVGPFGEVHLIIEHGRVRFIRTIKSEALEHKRS
jgi:hypothetical protein